MPSQIIAFDRATRTLTAPPGIRQGVRMLDAYGALSKPFMQRGLYKACRAVGAALWSGRMAEIRLAADAAIRFPASDPYWNRMLLRSYDHEPELARLLRTLAATEYGFVDCGANIGYWSVFAASSRGGGKPVLAVEASASTFALLEANAAPHRERVTTFHRAILDRSGATVRLDGAAHEARAIDGAARSGEAVVSVTIDDLVEQVGWSGRRLVVKLDVEGVEREALVGMEQALAADALVIYEDHGADPGHGLTRHIREDRRLAVRLLTEDGSVPIGRAGDLDRYKTDRTRGYNLVAMAPDSAWSAVTGG